MTIVFGIRGFWIGNIAQVAYQWYPQPHLYNARWFAVNTIRGKLTFSIVRNDFNLQHPDDITSTGGEPGWVDRFIKKHPTGFIWNRHAYPINNNLSDPPNTLGFGLNHHNSKTTARHDEYWNVTVPAWFVFLVFATLPTLWLRRFWKERRAIPLGCCANCGYDLRSSPDQCPECGTIVAEDQSPDATTDN